MDNTLAVYKSINALLIKKLAILKEMCSTTLLQEELIVQDEPVALLNNIQSRQDGIDGINKLDTEISVLENEIVLKNASSESHSELTDTMNKNRSLNDEILKLLLKIKKSDEGSMSKIGNNLTDYTLQIKETNQRIDEIETYVDTSDPDIFSYIDENK